MQLSEWQERVDAYKEDSDQYGHKELVFRGTLQFLVDEKFIRIVILYQKSNIEIISSDVLINQMNENLSFVLTNKEYMLLNKKPPLGKGTMYDGIKAYLTDKSVDAFAGAGADSILSTVLGV